MAFTKYWTTKDGITGYSKIPYEFNHVLIQNIKIAFDHLEKIIAKNNKNKKN